MGRKRAVSWRTRIAALVMLLALGAGGWAWWQAQHWAPPRAEFPVQGALIAVGAIAVSPLGYALIGPLQALSDRAAGSIF